MTDPKEDRFVQTADSVAARTYIGRVPRIPAPHTCNDGCGAFVEHFGICEGCGAKIRAAEHRARMRGALRSIPERYRDAVVGSLELRERVPDIDKIEFGVRELLKPTCLVLFGETGAGKTSLASSLMRFVIDDTEPNSHPDLIRRAEMALFVSATDLPDSKNLVERAKRASVAVIDDVGQEAGEGVAFAGNERCYIVKNVLEWRYRNERQTIVTTYDGPEKWAERYGAGVTRRFWEDPDSQQIQLRRKAR